MTRDHRWMVPYVLLGLVQSGMVPIVLPLAARPGPTGGFTYAAFAAAGIAAPFVGAWSDRHRRHRLTLAAGLTIGAAALALHTLPGSVVQHMVTAALIGFGVSSASTVATMFIVEVEPDTRWDVSIGQLQASISGGQLVGLPIAGLLGLRHVDDALLLAALLLALAVPLALRFAPDPVIKVQRPTLPPRAPRSGDAAAIGPQRSFHRVTAGGLRALASSGLAWFLAAWLLSYTATNGLSVMFAVAMVHGYGTHATLPTVAYALGVGVSLLVYRRVGAWDARFGPWRVLRAGLAVRFVLVLVMGALAFGHGPVAVGAILILFAGTQVIWPLLSVASTALSVTLSPARRAESVGLLNATTSLGATVGGALGGAILGGGGFALLCAVTVLSLAIAFLLAWHPHVRLAVPATADAAA